MVRKIFNYPHCGKIISKDILKADSIRKTVTCPECGSQRNYKDGLRYTRNGEIQRYLCRDCGCNVHGFISPRKSASGLGKRVKFNSPRVLIPMMHWVRLIG